MIHITLETAVEALPGEQFLQSQVFAEKAVVTNLVNCTAVGNPYTSRTCRQRWESTAVFRITVVIEINRKEGNPKEKKKSSRKNNLPTTIKVDYYAS